MEQRTLKNVSNYLNTNIYSYLETSGGQSSNLNLCMLIRHLWQLKTVVFLHWCLISIVLLGTFSCWTHQSMVQCPFEYDAEHTFLYMFKFDATDSNQQELGR